MNAKEQLQIILNNSSSTTLAKMIIVLAFWMMQRITNDECIEFATMLGYTFTPATAITSKGNDFYTVLQMLTMLVDDMYPSKFELGKNLAEVALSAAKAENYITATDYETLVAKL